MGKICLSQEVLSPPCQGRKDIAHGATRRILVHRFTNRRSAVVRRSVSKNVVSIAIANLDKFSLIRNSYFGSPSG